MTLREEIYQSLQEGENVDDIIKVFEKLIDEKIKETKELEAYKTAMSNFIRYPKTYHELIGRLYAFKELKEELTKQ